MPGVTNPTEKPGLYGESFIAIKAQMMKHQKTVKTFSPEEIDIMIKKSLIEKAKDKIEFSLRGEIRRGKHKKLGVSEEEFSEQWRTRMRKRLTQDGYPFELTKEELEVYEKVKSTKTKEAIEEKTKLTANALKKILSEV